jgi:hypothetical protein
LHLPRYKERRWFDVGIHDVYIRMGAGDSRKRYLWPSYNDLLSSVISAWVHNLEEFYSLMVLGACYGRTDELGCLMGSG